MPSVPARPPAVPGRLVLLDGCSWSGTTLPGDRTHAVLAALALDPGRVLGDGRLIEEVWGEDLPANATKALQVLISRVRSQTAPDLLSRSGAGYRLTPTGAAEVDAVRLRSTVDQAVTALADDPATARDRATAALAVSVSDVEDGLGPVAALHARAYADRSRARAVLGQALSRLGAHDDALPLLEQATAENGSDEALLADLLRTEAATRGGAAALDRFERYRGAVRDRLGTDPGPALRQVHAELLVHDQPVRTGLRWESTRLIGRSTDVAALAELTRTARVTSIVGAGGLGKTRLAHAVGRLADQPMVHFVELAGVSTATGVAPEVGSVVGVREATARRLPDAAARATLTQRILERIGDLPTLLIMDNCEHLVEAVAELVAELVSRSEHLHVLTTTRAPLGLAGERVYPLGQLDRAHGVLLFEERARAARPGVRLDRDEVERLVERLDGLPLAIELAAAKVKVMAVAEIARRLANRFALLRGGSRDAPERHQTLLAVIDWSWNLLNPPQQVALRRISLFRDGFSLDGAAEVIGVPDAVDVVSDLVDQSLVSVVERLEPGAGDTVRYRMLETVREFGRMQLVDAGDDVATVQRLDRWARAFALRQAERLYTLDQIAAVTALRGEEGNLTEVLVRSVDAGDRLTAVPVAAALCALWTIEGFHLKVINVSDRLERLLADAAVITAEVVEADGIDLTEFVDAERAVLVSIVTNTMIFSGGPSAPALDRLRELGPGTGPSQVRASTVVLLGFLGGTRDELADAMADLQDSPDPAVARMASSWASQAHENSGDTDLALVAARRALELAVTDEGPWRVALIRSQLAQLEAEVGHDDQARQHAEQSLPVMEALGAVEDATQLKGTLAMVAVKNGRLDDAERMLDEIERTVPLDVLLGGGVLVVAGRAELAYARGDVEEGLRLYRASIASLRARLVPWITIPENAPWVVFPESAALSAHVNAGRRAEGFELYVSLRAKTLAVLAGEETQFLDYPVVGCALYALGLWALAGPDQVPTDDPERDLVENGMQLVALADRFSYNRALPSLSFSHAVERAEARRPGRLDEIRARWAGRPATELRAVAADHILRV